MRSVDVQSMTYTDDGTFTKPSVSGTPEEDDTGRQVVTLGTEWELATVK
ncbi:hypothetical protein ACE062_02015 [Marinobacter shengliensis]